MHFCHFFEVAKLPKSQHFVHYLWLRSSELRQIFTDASHRLCLTRNFTKYNELWSTFLFSYCESKMVQLRTRVIWRQGCKSKNYNKFVWLRIFLTITARLRIRRACSCWEWRTDAPFFSSRNWTKITTTATFARFARQHSTESDTCIR